MKPLRALDRHVQHLGFIDIKLFSGSAFFAGLVIAQLFPDVLSVNVWAFIVLSAALALHPLVTLARGAARGDASEAGVSTR